MATCNPRHYDGRKWQIAMSGISSNHTAFLSTRAIDSLEKIVNSGNRQDAAKTSGLVSKKCIALNGGERKRPHRCPRQATLARAGRCFGFGLYFIRIMTLCLCPQIEASLPQRAHRRIWSGRLNGSALADVAMLKRPPDSPAPYARRKAHQAQRPASLGKVNRYQLLTLKKHTYHE